MNLRTPGPTPCPPEVLEAMSHQMINHRGREFKRLIETATARLKALYQTSSDVLILTASGTGGLEAAAQNCIGAGDRVLAISIGSFGDRFAQIAQIYGGNVTKLDFEWGTAADPAKIDEVLKNDPSIETVLVTHNETSTGVTNDVGAIAKVVKAHDKLLLVDAISSLGSIELPMDEWNCDVVVAGSQKGWMVPPGLVFVGVSPRAWAKIKTVKTPRFYFDLEKAKKSLATGETPWTPAVSLFYGLDISLKMLLDEGVKAVDARHRKIGAYTRARLAEIGLPCLADEKYASNTVTPVKPPAEVDIKGLLTAMEDERDIVLAGGQGKLDGKIFRIGHLGHVTEADIDDVIANLTELLPRFGFTPKVGAASA